MFENHTLMIVTAGDQYILVEITFQLPHLNKHWFHKFFERKGLLATFDCEP